VPSSTSLLGLVAAALVLLLIPGPGLLYIGARSLSQGHRAGLVSVLGLSVGALVHVAAATAGLSPFSSRRRLLSVSLRHWVLGT